MRRDVPASPGHFNSVGWHYSIRVNTMLIAATVEIVSVFAAFLGAAIGGVIGGAAGYFTHKLDWKQRERERAEEFRRSSQQMLLSRRVDALQEAYSWLVRLNDRWNDEEIDSSELNRLCREARQWWISHVYYLHDGMPGESYFLGAFNARDASTFFRFQSECTDYLRRRAEQFGLDPSSRPDIGPFARANTDSI